MTSKPLTAGFKPMHPGELLREEILPSLGRPKALIADLLRIGRQSLDDILDERAPVTIPMALRLGKLAGNGPALWLNLQLKFDLHEAEQQLAKEIAKIPTLTAT